MDLNWVSFIFEVINFLVLVWLLKRFLYRPIMDMIHKRQAAIEDDLNKASAERASAEKLVNDYEARFNAWEAEKEQARESLDRELATLRKQKLTELDEAISAERHKRLDIEKHHNNELLKQYESSALALAARFASKLLTDLASPDLCQRLTLHSMRQLDALPDHTRTTLEQNLHGSLPPVVVRSSHPLDEPTRQAVESKLQQLVSPDLRFSYQTDPGLIAGVSIQIDSLALDANLKTELKLFQEFSHAQ